MIKETPRAHEPYQTLGDFYEQMDQLDKSLEYFLIAAYLTPNDGENWCTVGEKHADQQEFLRAINCYTKAIKCIKDDKQNTECRLRRSFLYEELYRNSETDAKHQYSYLTKAIAGYEDVLQRLQPDHEPTEALDIAKKVAKLHFDNKNCVAGIKIMETCFEKYESAIASDDVNMYIELLIFEKAFVKALSAFSKFCGVEYFVKSGRGNSRKTVSNDSISYHSGDLSVILPQYDIPIDLRTKLIVSLIQLESMESVKTLQEVLEKESVEDMGDLYLDVAEAYMDKKFAAYAKPFLQKLCESESYGSQGAVWLRYARCLKESGKDQESISAYKKVVELVPNHYDARIELSNLLLQYKRSSEAVEFSSQPEDDEISLDLLLIRTRILYAQKKYADFVSSAKLLLSWDMIYLTHDKEITCMISSTTNRTRLESLKEIHRDLKKDVSKQKANFIGTEPSSDHLFEIFVKLCRVLCLIQKDYEELEKIVFSGYTCQSFAVRESSLDFVVIMSLYTAGRRNTNFLYLLLKAVIMRVRIYWICLLILMICFLPVTGSSQ